MMGIYLRLADGSRLYPTMVDVAGMFSGTWGATLGGAVMSPVEIEVALLLGGPAQTALYPAATRAITAIGYEDRDSVLWEREVLGVRALGVEWAVAGETMARYRVLVGRLLRAVAIGIGPGQILGTGLAGYGEWRVAWQ